MANGTTPGAGADLYRALDESEVGSKRWLTVSTAGMGFFTDAYDLFIIGTVTVLLTPIFHRGTGQISLLNSISLLASVADALTFGRLMDRWGRRRLYGVEVSILVVCALLTACAWNFPSLPVFRLLVGYGIGGDYASSGVITAEYANRTHRGRLVGTVFAMQGLGLPAGPAVASILLGAGVPNGVAWRLMLGFGAILAASVVYLRRRIRETPRFSLNVAQDTASAATAVAWVTGGHLDPDPVAAGTLTAPAAGDRASHVAHDLLGTDAAHGGGTAAPSLRSKPYLLRLVGTAGSASSGRGSR